MARSLLSAKYETAIGYSNKISLASLTPILLHSHCCLLGGWTWSSPYSAPNGLDWSVPLGRFCIFWYWRTFKFILFI